MESALQASSTLGVFGPLAKPAKRTRRRQSSEATISQGISSRDRAIDGRVTVEVQSPSSDYAREAIVEALSDATEAEDVTQEVFVRAYTQLATYKPAHKFSTWLLSIASHLAIDQLRRRRFLALPLEDVPFLEWIVDSG